MFVSKDEILLWLWSAVHNLGNRTSTVHLITWLRLLGFCTW